MAAKERVSITYYVGVVNIILCAIWGAALGFGILGPNPFPPTANATPFYVGTFFILGFGIVFPFIEKTMSGKLKINTGLALSSVTAIVYVGFVVILTMGGSLVFHDLGLRPFG